MRGDIIAFFQRFGPFIYRLRADSEYVKITKDEEGTETSQKSLIIKKKN